MSIHEERTKNILKVYEYLLANKLIEDKADFCRLIGISATQFGRVQSGEIYFPEDNELQLVRVFHVNVNYIYHGRGKMFWVNDPVKQIGVMDNGGKEEKKKMKGSFRSLENVDGHIDLVMN